MAIFLIGEHDISKHIVVGTYEVNAEDVFEDWVDGNYCIRHEQIRTRIKGSFEVYFRNIDEYQQFVSIITENKTAEGWLDCMVAVNNTNTFETNKAIYITKMEPVRDKAITGRDYFPQFAIEIEER